MRRISLVLAAVAVALLAAASGNPAVLLGDQTVRPSADSNPAGVAEAFQTTATISATVSKLTLYLDTGSSNPFVLAGLYADAGGHPGALLSQGRLDAPVAGTWNDVALTPAAVSAGSAYWIAILGPTGTIRFRDGCCGNGTAAETHAVRTLTALPSSWATGKTYRDGPLSAYVSSVDQPVLTVSPPSLAFTAVTGAANPAAQQLSVQNGGGGTLSWSAASDQTWLTLSPASGVGTGTISVNAASSSFSPGDYPASITITAAGAQGSPTVVGVSLHVSPAPVPDNTPPTVSVTAPLDGVTVTGPVTLTATAADNIGVAGVRFQLDGGPFGAEDTTAPYSAPWDTTTTLNGAHTIAAVARDAAGNTTTSTLINVSVQNTAPPPATTFLVGDQGIEPYVDTNPTGVAESFSFTATTSGSMTKLSTYIDAASTSSRIVVGVYADAAGHPGALLTQAGLDAPRAGAWNDVTVPAVSLTAGTNYWLALLSSGTGAIRFRDRCCGSGTLAESSVQTGLTALPSSWSTGRTYRDGPATIAAFGSNGGPPPSTIGQMDAPFSWPLVPVHMTLLPNGKVISWDGFAAALQSEHLWDPVTSAFTAIPYTRNLFCAGHALLADGRLFVAGGHIAAYVGLADATMYDSASNTWTRGPDMAATRWYPTTTTLPDGRVLVVSGDSMTLGATGVPAPLINNSNTLPEIYDPASNSWTSYPNSRLKMPLYPFMFVLPDGRIFDAGPDLTSRFFDPVTGAWSVFGQSTVDGHSAVMYRPGKILKSGTWADPDFPGLTVSSAAEAIDFTAPSPAWNRVASMNYPRAYHTLTVLPDGQVLATGGGTASDGKDHSKAVLPTEIWNPDTNTWTVGASLAIARLYHSSALLLPDGRVLIAGGGQSSGAINEPNGEIYSPPYLFKGPRPAISTAPAILNYGANFTVSTPDAARIASVSLIRLGSVTHNFDQNQRFQRLSFTAGTGSLTVTAPVNANYAPPGHYMLFVVDTNGVPSVSKIVRLPLPASDVTAPTVSISNPAANATVSGNVTVTATASDNVGVTGVQLFVDGAALGLEVGSAPYSRTWDTTLATNTTHTLTARARDAAGNATTSAPVTVTVSNTGPPPPPPPPGTGPVAAYSFDDGLGTTLADSTGNGHTGTISGATWRTDGHSGGTLGFNGTSDSVTIPDDAALDLTSGMTLEAWVYPTANFGWRTVLMKQNPTYFAYALYANGGGDKPSGRVFVGSDLDATGTATLPQNTWTHLATAFDGSSLKLYVNGAVVATRAVSGSVGPSSGPLKIGGNSIWNEWFRGRIDEVRLYARALSATEIQTDMTKAVGTGVLAGAMFSVAPERTLLSTRTAARKQQNPWTLFCPLSLDPTRKGLPFATPASQG